MAGFAVHLGDVVGMRILLDIGMAVVALQASMHAGAELVAVDGDAVTGCVLHRLVAVAGQAIRLGGQPVRKTEPKKGQEAERDRAVPSNGMKHAGEPLGWN